jgi:hypothetical protein
VLILSRRLPPAAIESCSAWTVELYRRILTLAIVKHGDRAREVEFETVKSPLGTSQTPAGVEDDALLQTASLEILAWEYAMTAAAYRRVGKGASLVLSSDGATFDTPASPEIERLIASLDASSRRSAARNRRW